MSTLLAQNKVLMDQLVTIEHRFMELYNSTDDRRLWMRNVDSLMTDLESHMTEVSEINVLPSPQ
jgi:hypothetical protein